jgi:hypothetical protein
MLTLDRWRDSITWLPLLSACVSAPAIRASAAGDFSGDRMAGTLAGALKGAARRYGITVRELLRRRVAGLKRCSTCRRWKQLEEFSKNPLFTLGRTNNCRRCVRRRYKETYVPIPMEMRNYHRGPRVPARDGDKSQALHRVNHAVDIKAMADPDTLPCCQCGHFGSDRRHNYHHHNGYSVEHHLDVIVLCTRCHHDAHGPSRHGECSPRLIFMCRRCGKQFRVLESYVKIHGAQEHCTLECRYGHPIKSDSGWGTRRQNGQP